jgi:hypothetical protein
MAAIGRKGGLAAHQRNAALSREADGHHREAARRPDAGGEEEGERHGRLAHGHSEGAHEHSLRNRRGSAKC